MTDDTFTPESNPKEPAFCARCDTTITEESAMPARIADINGLPAYELVCLACFVNDPPPDFLHP